MIKPTPFGSQFKVVSRGNFIAGEWSQPQDPNGQWIAKSPALFTDELGEIRYSYPTVDRAVSAAKDAFRGWRKTTTQERMDYLKKYQGALTKRADEISEMIARESGKPLWESKLETDAMIKKVNVIIESVLKQVQPIEIQNILEHTTGVIRYKPLGAIAVLGPFSFPGLLPSGHFIPALLTGNTVIFKPSEKCPFVGQLIAECFAESGIPKGVFNLIQGEKEMGRRLCVHEGVSGILFTGSYEVGLRIKQDTLAQHWKLVALQMGAKNATIVFDDADRELALEEVFHSAFVTAGQRCTSTARVLVHEKIIGEFIKKFHEKAKGFTIGHPLENPFMGPLIDEGAVDRYLKFLGIAVREGFEMIMRGKTLELKWSGNYVSPSICVATDSSLAAAKKSVYQQTELLAPNVMFIPFKETEQAIELANCTQYGLVASVFTQNRAIYEKCVEDLEMGSIHLNRATVGLSSHLPFGGLKKSGNFSPAALFVARACTTALSSLEAKLDSKMSDTRDLNTEGF